jgi:hypothetical protein
MQLFLFNYYNKIPVMKTIKNISMVFFILLSLSAYAQTDKATTARIVNEKSYVFVATTALPMNSSDINNILSKMNGNVGSGGMINLTGNNYDLKVMPDSIVAYLPYYGRSFSAPMSNDENGFKFTSTKFTYTVAKAKKGWRVTINIKDTRESQRFDLNIGENGYASLNVISNTKQSISFNGYIAERKEKSKLLE